MQPIRTPVSRAVPARPLSSELAGGWHFVRTPNPHGGADAISIMHTADTSRSDLDLAGLMIRCSEGGSEAVIVLIRAFPLRARPHVVLGKPGNETRFEATIAPPGTAILLPGDATTLVNGPWQAQNDLFIRVDDGQTTIRGVVALAGLQAAFKVLRRVAPRNDGLRLTLNSRLPCCAAQFKIKKLLTSQGETLLGDMILASQVPLWETFTMMTMLAMTAMLIGAVLGQRFRVFILVPAIVIGSAAILGFGMAHDDNLWSILLVIGLDNNSAANGLSRRGRHPLRHRGGARRQGFAWDYRGGTTIRPLKKWRDQRTSFRLPDLLLAF